MLTAGLNYLFKPASQKKFASQIKKITGFLPTKLNPYLQALRHHSVSKKIHESGSKDSNERLEFLGDALLNAIVSDYIFKRFPYKDEGFLTQLRSKIVSRDSLNQLAKKIGLSHLVQYDKKSIQPKHLPESIFGNALEAFIGAVYIDAGYKKCAGFVINTLLHHLDIDKLLETETNFKGRLIEYCQKQNIVPEFVCTENMEFKTKIFNVTVKLNHQTYGQAENTNKKKAEQLAAQRTLEILSKKADELAM